MPRQQCFEVFDGFCQGQLTEQLNQIGIGLDAIGLAGFDERVEICAGMGTGHRVAEQPIAATDNKRAYGVFAEVVINRPGAVFNKANQFRPLRREIMQGLAQQTAGGIPHADAVPATLRS